MSTFSAQGRDLTGWDWLKELHGSIFSHPEFAGLRIVVDHARDMPSTSSGPGGSADVKAGTTVQWNHDEDALDHHWEVRRLERRAASLRALMPASMDHSGQTDEECWTEITIDGIQAFTQRQNGDEDDSTITIAFTREDGDWRTSVEVSFVADMPIVDLVSISMDEAADEVRERGWGIGAGPALSCRLKDGEMHVGLDPAVLMNLEV